LKSELQEDPNFIELDRYRLCPYRQFVFIDSRECSAVTVFNKRNLKVKVKETWTKNEGVFLRYQFALCNVPKKNAASFIEAMRELKDNMPLLGYSDYIQVCEDLFGLLLENL